MNKDDMIWALNGLDDDMIIAAAPPAGTAAVRIRRRRTTRVALIAACLVLVLGGAVYATGFLNNTIYGPPQEGTAHIVTDDGEEKDVKYTYAFAYVPLIRSKDIKGQVNELKDVIKANILASREGKYVAQPPETIQHLPESYFVTGLTQEEAVEYIGYEYLEPTWFPYEKSITSTEVVASLNDISECELQSIMITTSNYDYYTGIVSPENVEGRLYIQSTAYLAISDYGEYYAAESNNYEGSMAEVITSPNGIKCYYGIQTEEEVENTYIMAAWAQVIKNDIVYRLHFDFSLNNRDEVLRIINEWAMHF